MIAMRMIRTVAVSVLAVLPLVAFSADDAVESGLAADLAARVAQLEERHARILKERDRIVRRQEELQQSYESIRLDLQRLQAYAVLKAVQSMEAQASRDDATRQGDEYTSASRRSSNRNAGEFNIQAAVALDCVAVQYEAQRLAIIDQLRQMDAVSRLAAERLLKVIEQLADIAKAAESLQKEYHQSQAEYWLVTDAQGRYCKDEARAVAHALEQVSANNPAGLLARGVALRRLGDEVQAKQHFDAAIESGGPCMPVALAAKGELMVVSGQVREGFRELAKARRLGKQDGRVAWLYAQALAADGRWASSEAEWRRLLQLGGHDAAAHRGLSLLFGAPPAGRRADPKNALRHARLACEAGGNTDWTSLDALAIAHAADGNFGEAAAQARRAADVAAGDKRELCLEHARKFEANERLTWNWRD
jgi:hypothetical protein